MIRSTHRGPLRGALVSSAVLLLVPTLALAQDESTEGAQPSLDYDSATARYRGLDDDGTGAEQMPMREPVPVPDAPVEEALGVEGDSSDVDVDAGADDSGVDVGVVPVEQPIRKLQESTADRRGDEPQGDPEDVPATRRPAIEYESALDAYSMYEESDGPDWVGANDNVGQIGGWKTYAREIYESASDDELNDGDQQ